MSKHPDPTAREAETEKTTALDKARETYESVDGFLSIREEDSTLIIAGKILLRILGIIVLILMSPFILLGLFVAFLAAF